MIIPWVHSVKYTAIDLYCLCCFYLYFEQIDIFACATSPAHAPRCWATPSALLGHFAPPRRPYPRLLACRVTVRVCASKSATSPLPAARIPVCLPRDSGCVRQAACCWCMRSARGVHVDCAHSGQDACAAACAAACWQRNTPRAVHAPLARECDGRVTSLHAHRCTRARERTRLHPEASEHTPSSIGGEMAHSAGPQARARKVLFSL